MTTVEAYGERGIQMYENEEVDEVKWEEEVEGARGNRFCVQGI